MKRIPQLFIMTYNKWIDDNPFRQSAIVAYYAILSLPALIVIILNVVGSIWGRDIVEGELIEEISRAVGKETAETIKEMIQDRGDDETSIFTTIMGIATLIYGSTGVFFQLQTTLDLIWDDTKTSTSGILSIIKSRAKSFGFILILGFILLISFLVTSILSAFSKRIAALLNFEDLNYLFAIDLFTNLFFVYFLFGALFKYLPSVEIKWRAVRIGAALTAILFIIGKYILAYYFGVMEPGSTYGAAGSIIVIMLWVSYSSLILFYGAHFTKVYSDTFLRLSTGREAQIGFKKGETFKN